MKNERVCERVRASFRVVRLWCFITVRALQIRKPESHWLQINADASKNGVANTLEGGYLFAPIPTAANE